MTRRSKIWLVVAALFTVANLVYAVVVAVQGEPLHAGGHVALMFLGAYFVRRIGRGRTWRQGEAVSDAHPRELSEGLTQLKQSLDAIAIEVERIGEGQRFITRVLTERGTPDVRHY